MSASIRAATPMDVERLVDLMEEFYRESGFTLSRQPARTAFERLLAEPALGGVWLIEIDRAIVGYVVLTLSFSMEYGALRGFVDDLFVQPDHRGRRFASAALAAVRADCLERGVRVLHAESDATDERAQAFYARLGFRDSGHLLLALALDAPIHAV